MAWAPKIKVFDEREAKNAIIAYIKANQADALAWANAEYAPPSLPPIKVFFKAPSTVTVFPALTFIQSEHQSVFEDVLLISFSLTLEIAIIHGDQETLADLSKRYAMAIESLLTNMPETTFGDKSIIDITSTMRSLDTVFAVQGKYRSKFIQIFQTKAAWTIEAAAYED